MEPRLRCERGGMRCSPGAGHVLAESLRASVKRREASSPPLPSDFRVEVAGVSRLELQSAVFEYIEAFYNRQRRHSTLAMLSPIAYEQLRLSPLGS